MLLYVAANMKTSDAGHSGWMDTKLLSVFMLFTKTTKLPTSRDLIFSREEQLTILTYNPQL